MAKKSKEYLHGRFEKLDTPTGADFADLIDSSHNSSNPLSGFVPLSGGTVEEGLTITKAISSDSSALYPNSAQVGKTEVVFVSAAEYEHALDDGSRQLTFKGGVLVHVSKPAEPSSTPTPTVSLTPTKSLTPTPTPTNTPTSTPTPSVTPTISVTPTVTKSTKPTPSSTVTPTVTPTPTNTPSNTATPSNTPSNTATPSTTPSNTATPSVTPSVTPNVNETAVLNMADKFLWLDATTITGLNNSDTVQTWSCRDTSGNTAYPSVSCPHSTRRPTYATNVGAGNRPVVQFNGSALQPGEYNDASWPDQNQTTTVMAVQYHNSNYAGYVCDGNGVLRAPAVTHHTGGSESPNFLMYVNGSDAIVKDSGYTTDTRDGNFHIVTAVIDTSGTSSILRVDGVLVGESTATANIQKNLIIGAQYCTEAGSILYPGEFNLGELIHFNKRLSESEMQTVECYMRVKWLGLSC